MKRPWLGARRPAVLVNESPTVCGERWRDCRPRPSTPTPSTSDTRDSGTTYSGRPPYDFRLAVAPNPLGAGAVLRRGHNRLTAIRTSERNSALDTRGCCIPCYMIEPTSTDLAAGPRYVAMPRDWTSSRAPSDHTEARKTNLGTAGAWLRACRLEPCGPCLLKRFRGKCPRIPGSFLQRG